jgi:hypothetical protein
VPRRTRTRQARRAEARDRQEREQAYAELEMELHREWREQPVDDSSDEASPDGTEADTSQPEATTDE